MDFVSDKLSSTAVDDSFIWPALNGVNETRVLELRPASSAKVELECSLIVADLSTALEFEALSYAWGKLVFPRLLHVTNDTGDDDTLKITEHLHAALVALRRSDTTRRLWIDAISIDQRNLREKSAQVAMMGSIYTQAKRVIVWLGPEGPASGISFAKMMSLSNSVEDLGMRRVSGAHYWFREPEFPGTASEALEILRGATEAHMTDTYSRAWFTRLWVIQEVFSAQDILVVCGARSLDWSDFATATMILWAAARKVGASFPEPDMLPKAWLLVKTRAEHIMKSLPNWTETDDYLAYAEMIRTFESWDCSDHRDRIYALTSLAYEDKPVRVDYRQPVGSVYTEFYAQYGSLGMLFDAGLCRRKLGTDGIPSSIDPLHPEYLPSWVPELRKHRATGWEPAFGDSFSATSASRGQRGWMKQTPQRLLVQALRYDRVESVLPSPWIGLSEPVLDHRTLIRQTIRLLSTIQEKLRSVYPTMEYGPSVLARTIVGGLPERLPEELREILEQGDPRQSEGVRLLSQWTNLEKQCLVDGSELQTILADDIQSWPMEAETYNALSSGAQQAVHFLSYIVKVLQRHNLFFTERAYFGLAPPGLRLKDEVIIVQGCREPLVVRRVLGSTESELVGPCYLHGVMDGETYYSKAIDKAQWLALV